MQRNAIICLGLLINLATASAASISGIVTAEGKLPEISSGDGEKYDSHRLKFAQRINYAELRDFVVYVDDFITNAPLATNLQARVDTKRINQQGAMFAPHVLPVLAGTTVEWPNNDNIFHNVFSMSEAKPFDLGLYKNPEVKRVTFDQAGRVDVFCSIHANMNCVVLVLRSPFYAVTDDRGRYKIPGLPAGTYHLKAWHERLPPQTQLITVSSDTDLKVDFKLGISNLPKY